MNLTTAIFLVNTKARAWRVNYDPDKIAGDYHIDAQGNKRQPLFKTLDESLKKDDLVVIGTGTRHGYTVAKLVEQVTIDFEDKTPVMWIVGKVDLDEHFALLKEESKLTEQIKDAEMKVRREQLFNALNLSATATALPLADNK